MKKIILFFILLLSFSSYAQFGKVQSGGSVERYIAVTNRPDGRTITTTVASGDTVLRVDSVWIYTLIDSIYQESLSYVDSMLSVTVSSFTVDGWYTTGEMLENTEFWGGDAYIMYKGNSPTSYYFIVQDTLYLSSLSVYADSTLIDSEIKVYVFIDGVPVVSSEVVLNGSEGTDVVTSYLAKGLIPLYPGEKIQIGFTYLYNGEEWARPANISVINGSIGAYSLFTIN